MMTLKGGVSTAVFILVSFLFIGFVFADVNARVTQADKIIRNAERKMHSGKNADADALLNEAAELIEQVKTEDPGNKKIVQVEKKYERLRKNVDKKLGNVTKKASSSGPAPPPKPKVKKMSSTSSSAAAPVKASGNDKLPSGVNKRLRDISKHLKDAERYISRKSDQAKYKLDQAAELFDEIEKKYSGTFDHAHPDFAAVQTRFDDLTAQADKQSADKAQAKTDAEGSKAAMEKQSAEWAAKFREFLSYPGQEGHNPDKLVFVPGTSEPEKFDAAQKHFDAFVAFYDTYKKTEFPNGKTWLLEDLGDNQAPLRIKDFEEGFSSRVASISGTAEKDIDAAMRYLEKDNGWQSDKKIKPNIVDHNRMTSIRKKCQNVISALGASDPRSKDIQAKLDRLAAKDKEHRNIRKERTFMIPDRYKGNDIAALKKKAQSLVKENKKEGGTPKRCTIISQNWQEQTVKEWTDTSKTTWRIRTTRSITGQVAAKTSDGFRLITVALAKDKQSDGSWGALYGNLHQYSDPMLESNINK